MSVRLHINDAPIHANALQHPQKLDGPSQRALIFSSACFAARVLLRFPTPERQS
jgi:hypothetical protein